MSILQKENKFRVIRGLKNLHLNGVRTVATIGSFDGIHLGHQMVLKDLKDQSQNLKVPSAVVIFEPQPQEYFSGEQAPARLMRFRDKIECFREHGIDIVVCLKFNESMRRLTATEFVKRVVIDGLAVKNLIIGDDFRFGCDRSGDYEMLHRIGKANDFKVQQMTTYNFEGERVSSTNIRKALINSKFDRAKKLLGKPFKVFGRVSYGAKVGRELGFPTANINLKRYSVPVCGVFAVLLRVRGNVYRGAANVGIRPTVGDLVKPILEVHLLNFNKNIYGEKVSVEFMHKVRDEKKFSNIESLVRNIEKDVKTVENGLRSKSMMQSDNRDLKSSILSMILIAGTIFILDQLTKSLIVREFYLGQRSEIMSFLTLYMSEIMEQLLVF